jgi:hypothetical protein
MAQTPSATFIDVTDPPGTLDPVTPNDGIMEDDAAGLQAIINWVKATGKQAVIYLPPSDGTDLGGGEGYVMKTQIDNIGHRGSASDRRREVPRGWGAGRFLLKAYVVRQRIDRTYDLDPGCAWVGAGGTQLLRE